MSYTPASHAPPPPPPNYYAATPPAPPPKPSNSSTPAQGPPLPPPPPGVLQNEPSELDASQGQHYQQQQGQQYHGQAPGYGPLQGQAAPQINIPPIEAGWLPHSLRDKNTTDLHNLLHDASLQAALLSDPDTTHPAIPAAQAHLTPLLESNIALATSLTNLESRLTQKRTQTQSRLLALRALEQQHRAKIAETEKALEQFSPMALYQRLSASVQEQEQLVRGVEESWLEMESDVATPAEVEAFVKRVKEARKVAFLRRERKERWDEARVGGWR